MVSFESLPRDEFSYLQLILPDSPPKQGPWRVYSLGGVPYYFMNTLGDLVPVTSVAYATRGDQSVK